MTTHELGVLSVFLTIDGECNEHGPGIWSVFVRFRGCSVGCIWCDTKYSWRDTGGTVLTPHGLADLITKIGKGCTKVTLTGGEPLEQDWATLGILIRQLTSRMSSVSVETSGTYDVEKFRVSAGVPHDPNLSFIVDWKLSSAKAKPNQPLSMYVKLRERDRIKFVVSSEADFNEAVEAARAIRARNRRTPIYFSPSFNALAPALLMEWMRRAGVQVDDIRLNLQIHKIIWPGDSRVEEDEGVDFTKRSLGREQFIERARTPDEKL